MLDVLLRNGRVIDGTGAPWFRADIGVASGCIVAIGPQLSQPARRVIDVDEAFVTPGFVDPHSHGDYGVTVFPAAENLLRQGVTTAIVGQCGVSLAPLSEKAESLILSQFPFLPEKLRRAGGLPWRSFGEYLAYVARIRPTINLGALVGHGALRALAMGHEDRVPQPDELRQMQQLLETCLEEGALGMSTGLIYPPGAYSTTDELISLATILRKHRRLYATHLRSETDQLLRAFEEALAIGRASAVSLHISHHKVAGSRNWGLVRQTLSRMETARDEGIDVTCDAYPYTAGSTSLAALLPPWAAEGGPEGIRVSLSKRTRRIQVAEALDESNCDWENLFGSVGPDRITLVTCPGHPDLVGKSLTEAAGVLDRPIHDALFDLICEFPTGTLVVLFEMSEDDVKHAICHRLSMICSDGDIAPALGGRLHPRTFGSFARALVGTHTGEYPIATEEMIRKMTSFPAQRMGLLDRGVLREGLAADILVFREEEIEERCSYDTPNQYARGMDFVMINGVPVIEQGKLTGARPGTVLRSAGDQPQGLARRN